jgi:hypothetical protein
MPFQVFEIADGRVLVDHDGLGIVLHGGRDSDQGKAIRIPVEDLVTGAQAEVGVAGGHHLRRAAVLRQGKHCDVETLGFVVAEHLRCKETALLGLRIPIELQFHRCKAALGDRGLGATAGQSESKSDRERNGGKGDGFV